MAIAQSDFLISLAYLLGERSVNATTSAPRADFIQNALADAYAAYEWRFARTNATLTISNGIATLPTNYDDNHFIHARFNDGQDEQLDLVDPDDIENVYNGDRAAWIEAVADETYVVKTKDSDLTQVIVRYQKKPPVLDSAGLITTPYPKKRTIVLGARRDVKLGQNPDADISQEQKLFDKAIANDIAGHQVPAPRKHRRQASGNPGAF